MSPDACNLCQGHKSLQLGAFHGRKLLVCQGCGLRWFDPLPSDEELRALYTSEQYLDADYFSLEDQLQTNHYQRLAQAAILLGSRIEGGGRVLEIGPGQGHFLKQCQDQGLEVEAIEFSRPMAQALRERLGCVVREGPLEASGLPPSNYQALAAFDLLEHVRDPMGWLKEAWRLLAPGGILVFSTVNVDTVLDNVGRLLARMGVSSPMAKLHPPYHLYYFTETIIKKYLQEAGFEIESLAQENYDPRKATSKRIERLALSCIYQAHNILGKRTNIYFTCRKPTPA